MIQNASTARMQTDEGKLTLLGVFMVYQIEIASNWRWNEKTLEQYRTSLMNTIIPCIDDHNVRAIDAYTPQYINLVIDKIKELGYRRMPETGYALETLKRFRHIMNVTVRTAIIHMLCTDIWDRKRKTIKKSRSSRKDGHVVRFFAPEDEMRIIQYIRDRAGLIGEMRGLFLMMCTRCRENEIAGLTWGMIRENEADPRLLTVSIMQTTQINSSRTKIGGKTANAPRQITLTLDQSDVIRAIRRELEEMWVKKGGDLSRFNQLRVVCRKNKLSKRCSSRNISEAANEMFFELGLSDIVENVSMDLAKNAIGYAEDPDFWEENPETSATCYTLRRAAATFDRVLGIEMKDRQYLMGHVVTNASYSHIFADAEHQCAIAQKAADRPGLNKIRTSTSVLNDTRKLEGKYRDTILASVNNGRIEGWIITEEPGDQIRLEVKTTVPCKMIVKTFTEDPPEEYSWYVNVKRQLHEMYIPKKTEE